MSQLHSEAWGLTSENTTSVKNIGILGLNVTLVSPTILEISFLPL
jgi:hypothetical protein